MEAAGAPRGRPAQRLSGAVRSPQLWGKENADPRPQAPAEKLPEKSCAKQEFKSEAQFEAAIASGAGDIVQVWCDYVQFAGGSLEVLQRACTTLASDPRYAGDVRHLRLWVTSAREVDRPQETFEALERSGIGLEHALLYEAWAASLERARLFDWAGAVYERGIEAGARPVERLRNRFKEFQGRMRKRAERDAMRARRRAAPASSPPLSCSPANSGTPSASPAQEERGLQTGNAAAPASSPPLSSSPANSGTPSASPAQEESLRALSPSPAASASRPLVLHWGELPASNWQVDLPPVAPDSPEAPVAGGCHPSASSRPPPDGGGPRASRAPQEPLASPDSAAKDALASEHPSAGSRPAASRGSPRASQEPLASPDSEVAGPVGGHLLGSELALDSGSPCASPAPGPGSAELTASSWMDGSALGATSLGLSASVSRPSCAALDSGRSAPPAATPSSLASSPTLHESMPLLQRWARAHAPGLLNQSSGSGFETPQHTCYFQTSRHSEVEAHAPHTPEPVARSRSPSPPAGAELADAAIAGDVGDAAFVAAEQHCQSALDAPINEDSESQHAAALAALATKWAPSAVEQPTAKIEPRKSKWAAVPVADSHKTWHRNGGALSGAPLLWRRRNSDPDERIGQAGEEPASELPSINEIHGTDMDGNAMAVGDELPSSSELQPAKELARRRVSSEKFKPPRWSAVRRLSGQDIDEEEEEAEMPQWSALRLPVSRPMAPEQFASPLPAAAPHLLSPAAPETNEDQRGREVAPAPASPPPWRPACSPRPSPSGDDIAVAQPSPSPSPPQERAQRPRSEDVSVEEVRAAALLAQLLDAAAPQVVAA